MIDWHGASIDPRHKLLIASANYIPFMVTMKPRGPFKASGKVPAWDGSGKEPDTHGIAAQYGAGKAIPALLSATASRPCD